MNDIPLIKVVRVRFLEYPDKVVGQIILVWTDDTYSFQYSSLDEMFEKLPIEIKKLKESND